MRQVTIRTEIETRVTFDEDRLKQEFDIELQETLEAGGTEEDFIKESVLELTNAGQDGYGDLIVAEEIWYEVEWDY